MTAAELQERIAQSYDRTRWLDTLRQILPQTLIFGTPQTVPIENSRAESVLQLAKIPLAGGRHLAVLEIVVNDRLDLPRNRVGLRQVVARCIDQAEYHGVLAIFHQRSAKDYRFTFAAREAAVDNSGQLVRTETAPRRFTYLLGPNESCRTAAERFDLLGRRGERAELKDVIEAFNVEKLNKEFFAAFRKSFEIVVNDVLARNQGWERADAECETQTLLSRLLFLYFIQRKGWLNRQRDYLVSAFNRYSAEDAAGTSFNDKFLRHFFVKLSAEDAFFPQLDLGDLPFLNGGLFDDEIGSLTARGRIRIGNPAFRHVFDDLLEAYNFTVREDTPLDQEVAIDPEMLGKIFESLVLQLEQSDTGGKTSRHDTGSYYTPRPIVHYLCREGLRAWLEQFPSGNSGDWPARLEKMFALEATDGLDDAARATLHEILTPDDARALDDRLDGFRACDPAVGSGAFLVGLLHELLNLHRLCQTRARGKDPATDNDWLYETKKRIIENVLYGVDIQQRAVEICKLRLWISLMVDYPLEVDPDNCALPDFRRALKKITPLPNLDFKIRRADSLIEQIRGHAIKFPQAASDSRDFALSLHKLATAKHRFYEARLKKEKRLAQLDALDATAELAKYEFSAAKLKYGLLPGEKEAERTAELDRAEAEMGNLQMQIAAARRKSERDKDDAIERLSRVFNDEAKPTFVWQLDFAEIFHRAVGDDRGNLLFPNERATLATGKKTISGFDLVLANPPYVRQEKIKALKPALQNTYDCFDGRADLYVYFYERGVKLLGKGGVLSFISSNKFFRAGYGENLRTFLGTSTQLRNIIDFGDLPIFDATAYPCIVIAQNIAPIGNWLVRTLNVGSEEELNEFLGVAKEKTTKLPQSDFGKAVWQLQSSDILRLLAHIRSLGTPLGSLYPGKIYAGIKTGLNDAFIIDAATRNALIREDRSSSEIIKPFLKGKDVGKWVCESGNRFIIYTPHGIDIEKYPAIKRHLNQFRRDLENRALDQKWYELQQPQLAFTEGFLKTKIVYPNVALGCRFAMDAGSYLDMTSFCICSSDLVLLAILNSTVMNFFFSHLGIQRRGGYQEFKTQYVKELPIPDVPPEIKKQIALLVEYAVHLSKECSNTTQNMTDPRQAMMQSYFEQLIDAMMYELFFPDELHRSGKHFLQPLAQENLPPLCEISGNKTATLQTIFARLFDKDHVIRKNRFFLDTLEIVRIIEAKA